jgi:hypothetical protein
MSTIPKSLAHSCALGIAGCAQSGFGGGPGALPLYGTTQRGGDGDAGCGDAGCGTAYAVSGPSQ